MSDTDLDVTEAPSSPIRASRTPRWLRVLGLAAAGVLGFVLLVAIGIFAGLRLGAPSQVEVRDVRGREVGIADALLRDQGFFIALEPTVAADEVPLHQVVATDPPAGTVATQGDIVRLIYQSNPGTGLVPPMTGLPENEAAVLLVQAGLAVGEIRVEPSDDIPEGHVITCDPPDGVELPLNTPVLLVISNGPAR